MARDCATSRGMTTLAFSGGVLHNRLLVSRLTFIWRILLCCFRSSYLPEMGQSRLSGGRGRGPSAGSQDIIMIVTIYASSRVRCAGARTDCGKSARAGVGAWAWQAFGDSGALMAASLLAWGVRIAPCGRCRPYRGDRQRHPQNDATGAAAFCRRSRFSFGHSSIVVLASAAIPRPPPLSASR